LQTQSAAGETAETNPSLVTWHGLPDALKASNRAFARRIGPMLAARGLTITPLADPRDARFRFDEAEVEGMAEDEHDRWERALRADGWQPTDGVKDAERKLHPLLVPWATLSEDDRDKDRHAIRALPRFVGMLGYQIVSSREVIRA
jgi:hypothetical protein